MANSSENRLRASSFRDKSNDASILRKRRDERILKFKSLGHSSTTDDGEDDNNSASETNTESIEVIHQKNEEDEEEMDSNSKAKEEEEMKKVIHKFGSKYSKIRFNNDANRRREDDIPEDLKRFINKISIKKGNNNNKVDKSISGMKRVPSKKKSKPMTIGDSPRNQSSESPSNSPPPPKIVIDGSLSDTEKNLQEDKEEDPKKAEKNEEEEEDDDDDDEVFENKKKNLSNIDYKTIKANTKFTEYEISSLWNQFKDNFPSGRINRLQLSQLLKQIFPRKGDPSIVVENIMRLFDTDYSGSISFRELMIAFSMSMKGSVEEKLHWAFKLYDKDSNNEIDLEEMTDIFGRLCKIACGNNKKPPSTSGGGGGAAQLTIASIAASSQQESSSSSSSSVAKLSSTPPDVSEDPLEDVKLMSRRIRGRKVIRSKRNKTSSQSGELGDNTPPAKPKKKKDVYIPFSNKKAQEKVKELLNEEDRDCSKFNAQERAKEIFSNLDVDGDGGVTEDEFIKGCCTDKAFITLLQNFNGDEIWGDLK